MIKTNVISSEVTPCSTPGCSGRADVIEAGRAICSRCVQSSAKQAMLRERDVANLGSDPTLVSRHEQ